MNQIKLVNEITINDKELQDRCMKFAIECTKTTSEFNIRNGSTSNVSKLINDRYNAVLAEWAVYFHVIQNGGSCQEPDMEIYEAKQKSHGADLVLTDGTELSIKSQLRDSVNRVGMSFLTMKWAFNSQKHRRVMYVICEPNNVFKVYKCGALKDMIKGECKYEKARATKDAFYLTIGRN